MIFNATRKS